MSNALPKRAFVRIDGIRLAQKQTGPDPKIEPGVFRSISERLRARAVTVAVGRGDANAGTNRHEASQNIAGRGSRQIRMLLGRQNARTGTGLKFGSLMQVREGRRCGPHGLVGENRRSKQHRSGQGGNRESCHKSSP
jgi:hypothetical protein